jgi:hypothetical protein
LAEQGKHAEARTLYEQLANGPHLPAPLRALVLNDLATLSALGGDAESARRGFEAALALDPGCELARANLATLHPVIPPLAPPCEGGDEQARGTTIPDAEQAAPHPNSRRAGTSQAQPLAVSGERGPCCSAQERPVKVAILSFLFNWPSTGGGIVHTVELAQFLRRAGYDVKHLYARYLPWGIGEVPDPVTFSSEAIPVGTRSASC